MRNGVPVGRVRGRVSGARGKPPVELAERNASRLTLLVILPLLADVLVHDAVRVQMRLIADASVPRTVMPRKPNPDYS